MTTVRAFTVATLADAWGCSEGVIRKMIAEGQLGCFRLGSLIRIPAEEVRRFECQNIPSSGSEADTPSSIERTASGGGSASSLPIAPQRKRKLAHGGHALAD